MLNFWGRKLPGDCEGSNRRDFLKIGTLGLTGLGLPHLLRDRANAASEGRSPKETSVVWIWLGGGATHIETFDPKMEAPVEFRSCVGSVATNVPGIEIGGLFPKIAQKADQMAFLRSFAHGNSGHAGGTHFVMTGVDYPPADAGILVAYRPNSIARARCSAVTSLGRRPPASSASTSCGISDSTNARAVFRIRKSSSVSPYIGASTS